MTVDRRYPLLKKAISLDGTGAVHITGTATTQTTSPAAGGAGALPATPAGYLSWVINGVARLVAYY